MCASKRYPPNTDPFRCSFWFDVTLAEEHPRVTPPSINFSFLLFIFLQEILCKLLLISCESLIFLRVRVKSFPDSATQSNSIRAKVYQKFPTNMLSGSLVANHYIFIIRIIFIICIIIFTVLIIVTISCPQTCTVATWWPTTPMTRAGATGELLPFWISLQLEYSTTP